MRPAMPSRMLHGVRVRTTFLLIRANCQPFATLAPVFVLQESEFSRARKRTQSIRATRKALGLREPVEFSDDTAGDSASPTCSRPTSLYIEATTEIAEEATESPVRGSRIATGSQSTSGLDAMVGQPTPPTRKKGRRVSAPVDAFDYRPQSVSVTPDLETDEGTDTFCSRLFCG